jgi:hypothetical protein
MCSCSEEGCFLFVIMERSEGLSRDCNSALFVYLLHNKRKYHLLFDFEYLLCVIASHCI